LGPGEGGVTECVVVISCVCDAELPTFALVPRPGDLLGQRGEVGSVIELRAYCVARSCESADVAQVALSGMTMSAFRCA